jgi:hypothetical protein
MLVVLAVEDSDSARRFVAAEPYARHGLFEKVELARIRQFIPSEDPQLLADELQRERQRRAAPA